MSSGTGVVQSNKSSNLITAVLNNNFVIDACYTKEILAEDIVNTAMNISLEVIVPTVFNTCTSIDMVDTYTNGTWDITVITIDPNGGSSLTNLPSETVFVASFGSYSKLTISADIIVNGTFTDPGCYNFLITASVSAPEQSCTTTGICSSFCVFGGDLIATAAE
jgi:hypothetical protein